MKDLVKPPADEEVSKVVTDPVKVPEANIGSKPVVEESKAIVESVTPPQAKVETPAAVEVAPPKIETIVTPPAAKTIEPEINERPRVAPAPPAPVAAAVSEAPKKAPTPPAPPKVPITPIKLETFESVKVVSEKPSAETDGLPVKSIPITEVDKKAVERAQDSIAKAYQAVQV